MNQAKFQHKNVDPLERKAAAAVKHRLKTIRDDDANSLLNNKDDDYSDIHDIWEDDESESN